MKNMFLLLLVLLAGCVNARQVSDRDGDDAFEIQCGIAAKSKCIEKAARLCPYGYRVFDHDAELYNDLSRVGSAALVNLRSSTTMTMQIQCR